MKEVLGEKKELQILIIEDNDVDVFRMHRELKKAGFVFRAKCVLNKEDFLAELQARPPDLVLSDHGLPSFDGFTALDLLQKKCPEVPFIFVTGLSDQGTVVEMFESGAADYVYKNRLSDLGPAVRQALCKAAEPAKIQDAAEVEMESHGQAQSQAGQALAESKTDNDCVAICSVCKKVRNDKGQWERLEDYLQKHSRATISLGVCPECAPQSFGG